MKSRFVHNTGWIIGAQIYQMLLSLVIGVISARYLGPTNYGTISYAAAYVSFFTIASALGLEGIVVREIIRNRDKEGVILGSSIAMRFIAGLLSMIILCIIVFFLNPYDEVLLMVAFLQSLVLPFNAFKIIDTWYQSYLKSKISSTIKIIAYTCMSLYKVWLLVSGKSVEWFAFATSLDALVIAILFYWKYNKDKAYKLKFDFKICKHLLNFSYPLIISSIMAVIYNQMDKIMIGKFIDQTHVGYYAAASIICHMWLFVPQALSNSARPLIMELKDKNIDLYKQRLRQISCLTIWIGIIFACIVTLSSSFIINILFGEEYASARTPLLFIIWSTVFASLSNPRSIWMISENKQKYIKNILFFGVIVNLCLNMILIPVIGINGAALATLVTEISCCLIVPYFIKETREYVECLASSFNFIRIIKER